MADVEVTRIIHQLEKYVISVQPHGTRFRYVLIVTEEPTVAAVARGATTAQTHLLANGYGAPGSENFNGGIIKALLATALGMMKIRAGKS